MKWTSSFIAVIMLIVSVLPVFPAEYAQGMNQVNTYYVAIDGDDANEGTEQEPFGSFAHSLSLLEPGDTLVIKSGTYSEALILNGLSGTASSPITIQGEEGTSIQSHAYVNSPFWKNLTLSINDSHYVTISNIEFSFAGTPSTGDSYTVGISGSSYINLQRNDIYASGPVFANMFMTASNDHLTLDGNYLTGAGRGIYGSGLNNATIINNIFTQYWALDLTNNILIGNTISNNVFAGSDWHFYSGRYQDSIFTNNIYLGKPLSDVVSGNTISHNLVTSESNKLSNTDIIVANLSNEFESGSLYRLKADSEFIGAGTSLGLPEYDRDGRARYGSLDIGPYSYGSIYYLDANADGGGDGRSEETAFNSIDDVNSVFVPGATLLIKPGSYSGNLELVGNGVPDSKSTTITKLGTGTVSIDGGANPAISLINVANVTVSDLSLSSTGTSALLVDGSASIDISESIFTTASFGIELTGNTQDSSIYNNTFIEQNQKGIWIKDSTGNKIYNNVFDNYKNILNEDGNMTDTQIMNNVMISHYGDGANIILKGANTGNIIANNIFRAAGPSAIAISDEASSFYETASSNIVDYNLYDNTSSGLTSGKPVNEENSVFGNPMFVSATDFRLQAGSAAINRGFDLIAPEVDRDGGIRYGRSDIGAYEYAGDSSAFYVVNQAPQGNTITVTSKIEITVSEEANNNNNNFGENIEVSTVVDGSKVIVAGSFSTITQNDQTVIVFTPNNDLNYDARYTVTIKKELESQTQNYLVSDVTWSFQTEAFIMNEYYISENGSDANVGTIQSPKRTVSSDLIAKLKAGDTVYFRGGTYNGVIVLQTFSGTASQPITFKSYEGENAVLTSDNSEYIIYLGHSKHIRVEGLTFAPNESQNGSRGTAIRVDNHTASRQQSSNITITDNTFLNTSTSIATRDLVNVGFGELEYSNNEMFIDSGWGLYFQEVRVNDGSYAKIYNNVIYDAARSLQLWGRSENLLFYNNTFADTYDAVGGVGRYDIYPVQGSNNANVNPLDISTNLVFKNNIFTKPIRTQLEGGKSIIDSGQNVLFDNNVYSIAGTERITYNNGGAGPILTLEQLQSGTAWANQGRALELNGKSGEVSFVNPLGDARIIFETNLAIGVADSVIVPGVEAPTTDIHGNARSRGEAGAFAYDETFAFVGENSGTGDGSLTNPYPSIQTAVSAGARNIQMLEGTYTANETINMSEMDQVGDVQISPYKGEVVLSGNISILGTSGQAVKVSNITIEGNIALSGDNVTLEGNQIRGTLQLEDAESSTIMNNTFASSSVDAIVVVDSSDALIANNVIYNRQTAMMFSGNSTLNMVYNNTMYSNANDVVFNNNASDNTFRNNIFSTFITGNGNNDFDYNLYNADTISASDLATITEAHAVKDSASFINAKAGDFRIYKQSVAIGAGVTDSNTPSKDINGVVRITPSDIGAYTSVEIINSYYVDASTGNDSGAGTADDPFQTIGAAVAVLRHGEKIIVNSGTYNEDIEIEDRDGQVAGDYQITTAGNVMLNGQIIVDSSNGVTIDGFNVNPGSVMSGVLVSESSYTILSNLNITSATDGIYVVDSPELVIEHSVIQHVETGITVDGDGLLSVTSVSIDDASVAAIEVNSLVELTLQTSLIQNSAKGLVGTGSASFIIMNNTFYDIAGYSVDIEQASASVFNNIFARSTESQDAFVRIDSEQQFISDYNLYDTDAALLHYNGEDLTLEEAVVLGYEENGLTGDPLFVDETNGDFHLVKGSTASRNGSSTVASFDENNAIEYIVAPANDYEGTAYSSFGQDIGAYYSPYSMRVLHLAGDNAGLMDGDGSEERPFRTLGQAIAAVDSGDTIIVHKGIYKGRFDINDKHGTADAPITIKASDDPNHPLDLINASLPAPIFTGKTDYEDRDAAPQDELMTKITYSSFITIEGLDITGFRGAGIWTLGSNNIVLRDLDIWGIDTPEDITSGVQGLLINNTTDSLFQDIRIWDIGQARKSQADHGAYIGYGSNLVFDGLKISNSPGGGIQFYSGDNYNIHATDIVVKNSVFSESKYGLIIVGVEGLTVTNNTFYNSWSNDLYLDWNVRNNLIQNNIFYNDRTEDYISEDGPVKPVVVGYQYNAIRTNPDQSTTQMVVNNTFRNNMYEYRSFPANARHVFDILPLEQFMAEENEDESNNKYENMLNGQVHFRDTIAGVANDDEKAQLIFDNILDLTSKSDAINKGVIDSAPTVDILGRTRVGMPDLGAYEYISSTSGEDTDDSTDGETDNSSGSNSETIVSDTVYAESSQQLLNSLFEVAGVDAAGVQTIVLHMGKVEGASRYVHHFPIHFATGDTPANRRIVLNTPIGTTTLPSNMLTGMGAGQAERFGVFLELGTDRLQNTQVKNVIGNQPLLTLGVLVDDESVNWINKNAPILVSMSYEPTEEEAQNPEHIVIQHISESGVVTPVTDGKYDPETGKITFTTTQSGYFTVAFLKKSFDDLGKYKWAEKQISVLASKGIINGVSINSYAPEANVKRADFIKLLVSTLGLSSDFESNFTDVDSTDYFYEAVGVAKTLGITQGIGENKFNPNGLITRQEMMVMVYHALKVAGKLVDSGDKEVLENYSDQMNIASYAREGIEALVSNGIIQGSNNRINPLDYATRAETAVLMYSIYNK